MKERMMFRNAMMVVGAAMIGTMPAAGRQDMTFFITSAGPGDGANLGGLAGADRHCQALASSAGFGDYTWRAYLGAVATSDASAVNARDRIGTGPWYNVKHERIARNVDDLHSDNANLTLQTILTEKGNTVNGRDESLRARPSEGNMHDILTGSNLDGTVYTADDNDNCENWTSNGAGSARVGHHDRQGGGQNPTSWNSAHGSRGCGQEDLQGTGGNGFFFCFAQDAGNDGVVKKD